MLKQYFILRFRSLFRLLRSLGFVGGGGLIVLSSILILNISNVPDYYWVFSYVTLELMWHLSRRDDVFLQTLFERKYKILYIFDYVLLSIPFIGFLIHKSDWVWVAVIMIFSMAIPVLPRIRLSILLPTFPLLAKGSYEYARTGRFFLPLWIILLVISAVGVFVDNDNLVVVMLMLTSMIVGMFVSLPVDTTYIFNYRSFRDFLGMKTKQACVNTIIILGPFIIMQLISQFTSKQFVSAIMITVGCALYLLQVQFLRFICNNNGLAQFLLYLIVSVVLCISLVNPICHLLSLAITLIMVVSVRSSLKVFLE